MHHVTIEEISSVKFCAMEGTLTDVLKPSDMVVIRSSLGGDKCLAHPMIVVNILPLLEVSMKLKEVRFAEWIEILGEGEIQGDTVASLHLRKYQLSLAIGGDGDCSVDTCLVS